MNDRIEEEEMEKQQPLSRIAHSCVPHDCPSVYLSPDGDGIIVQGKRRTAGQFGIELASDEEVVWLPGDAVTQLLQHFAKS